MYEPRHDHSVLSGLTRADGIEKPHHDDGQTRFLVVRKREKFVESFRTCVRPAMFVCRAGQKIVVFPEGDRSSLAINFGGTWDQNALSITRTKREHDVRAAKDRLDRANGTFHDELDADGARH